VAKRKVEFYHKALLQCIYVTLRYVVLPA